jgi:hypothetical protein
MMMALAVELQDSQQSLLLNLVGRQVYHDSTLLSGATTKADQNESDMSQMKDAPQDWSCVVGSPVAGPSNPQDHLTDTSMLQAEVEGMCLIERFHNMLH